MDVRTIVPRIAALLRRRRLERDLDDELAFHLAMREADYRRDGITATDARAAARRRFGNVTRLKEQCRDMWTFHPLETLAQDVRYALRTMRRSPGFTLVAVFALAVGIGGNTAIFSLLDAARTQALPYRDPERLVLLWGNVQRARVERRGTSYPDFADWRARSRSFDEMAAFAGQLMTLTGNDDPERINTEFVSAPYFSLLEVQPLVGRTFTAEEDDVAKPTALVVMSDGLWRRRFGGDPQIVGRTLTLCCAARSYTVVGVMPPGFTGLTDAAELWVPFAMYAPPDVMAQRGTRGFAALARLKRGVAREAAQHELDGISRQLEAEYPATNEKRGVEMSPLDVELVGAVRPALRTLMAAVAFVLLIACANVANLLLARSEARRREIAVRTALGAGRTRLLRQLITEGCVLTGIGAVAGLVLARVAVAALIAQSPVTFPSFVTPGLDARVAGFTVAVSLLCGILVGLAPGLQARAVDLSGSLKESARGSDGPRSQRVRGSLVVAELSLAVVLLVGAGLMIRSVRNLAALDPGFDPSSVLTLHVSIPRGATPPAAAGAAAPPPPPVIYGRALLERLRAIPGVTAAALGTDVPLDGNAAASFYAAEGQPPVTAQNMPRAYVHRVSPEFFGTLRIPLLAGRAFTDVDQAQESTAVIVSDRVVKRFWPGQSAIGKRIKFGQISSSAPWLTITGVVGEVKYRGLPDNPTADPDIYLPFADRNQQVALAIRGSVPPASLVGPLRTAIRSADPTMPIYGVAPMDELIAGQTAQSRFTMWLMGVFAAAALMLAIVGIYGVMAYLVTQRTREIGIRLALGAERSDILRLVVGSGARLVAGGVAIGVVASFALQRLVASLLFGVTAADSASAIAVAVLAAVALLACYVPAVRASRVNPLGALRYE
ncbi:MAG TPA: ABC transporter permease [Vicinamibacterales bacterium]|nr:ABC transporter permease [Vicinamibacterales bacterium]